MNPSANPILRSAGSMQHPLQWESDALLCIDGVEFHLATATQEMLRFAAKPGQFLLAKTRWMVEDVAALRESERIQRILDVGILQGGSTALYAKLFEPEKLAAIDVSTAPVDALSDFIREHGFAGRITPYYGVNQADEHKMGRILASDFPEQNIDLVVDDASHLYFETRKTFNLALPYLRPDGLYIIEDWGWAHWQGDEWQKSQMFPPLLPAMSNLLIELFMLCASRPDIVKNLFVTPATITLRRGPAALAPTGFDIGQHYLTRDRWFKPVL